MKAAAVIVAAGSSRRMGFDKLMAPLAGKPVVDWSLGAAQACGDIESIVLVCAEERIPEFTRMAGSFPKVLRVVAGGAERSASVLMGLGALAGMAPDLVAVHDAARPLVSPALFSAVLDAAAKNGAASAAHAVTDSLHRTGACDALVETVSRENLFAMETPQAARFGLLLNAVRRHGAGATDEVGALIASGVHPVPVVHGGPNLKITVPGDLRVAGDLLRRCGEE
jgi:2-C-methyl-D-erythritol 4-phosphate cytidylyltransferase